jgi:DNA-binding transcriptional regulator LsrR (DeoR family)
MAQRIDPDLRDELVFAVCERFFKGDRGQTLKEIADSLNRELNLERRDIALTRERIYPMVREGVELGYVVLSPPVHRSLSQRLADRYRVDPGRIRVVNVRGKPAAEHLATAGADVLFALIEDVATKKEEAARAGTKKESEAGKTGREKEPEPVHLGLGSGWTTMLVARRLVQRMRQGYKGPGLVLHALSSGFDANDPLRSPVAFFGPFQELPGKVSYVGLFVSAAVPVGDYEKVKKQPGVRESFDRAHEIDIVVSSLASAQDEHGALNSFFKFGEGAGAADLRRQGWLGDVQYLPLGKQGPIRLNRGIRAITLLELPDFVSMVKKDKYVVLVAGPCGNCGRTKEDALIPLLEEPSLKIWSHLVTDVDTANKLLSPDGSGRKAT